MSFDLNLPTVCNHQIYRELAVMDTDRRSLRVTKPIAANGSVEVWASQNFVPKSQYTIVGDPETINVQRPKMVYFNSKWRSPNDLFEVTYVTLSGFCPKCAGLDVLDDISIDVQGKLKTLRDEKLLLQNMEKFTVTEIRSNPFHLFIGSSLVTLLGEKLSDTDFMISRITQEINNSLSKFMDLQEQYRLTGRKVTDGEMLETIDSVEVTQDVNDPTILRADVEASSRSGKSVEFSQTLKIIEV